MALIIFVNLTQFQNFILPLTDSDEEAIRSHKDTGRIDHSLVLARALGNTTQDRAASVLSKRQKTKMSIVISHCDKPVDWIAYYLGEENFQVSDVTIISKCGMQVSGWSKCSGDVFRSESHH